MQTLRQISLNYFQQIETNKNFDINIDYQELLTESRLTHEFKTQNKTHNGYTVLFDKCYIDVDNQIIKRVELPINASVYESTIKQNHYHIYLKFHDFVDVPNFLQSKYLVEKKLDTQDIVVNSCFLTEKQGILVSFFGQDMLYEIQREFTKLYNADANTTLFTPIPYKETERGYVRKVKAYKKLPVDHFFYWHICNGNLETFFNKLSKIALSKAMLYDAGVYKYGFTKKIPLKRKIQRVNVNVTNLIKLLKYIIANVWKPGHRQTLSLCFNGILYKYVTKDKTQREMIFQNELLPLMKRVGDEEYWKRIDVVKYDKKSSRKRYGIPQLLYILKQIDESFANKVEKILNEKVFVKEEIGIQDEEGVKLQLFTSTKQQSQSFRILHILFFLSGFCLTYFLKAQFLGKKTKKNNVVRVSFPKHIFNKSLASIANYINGFELKGTYRNCYWKEDLQLLKQLGWIVDYQVSFKRITVVVNPQTLITFLLRDIRYDYKSKKFILLGIKESIDQKKLQNVSRDWSKNIFQIHAFIFKLLAYLEKTRLNKMLLVTQYETLVEYVKNNYLFANYHNYNISCIATLMIKRNKIFKQLKNKNYLPKLLVDNKDDLGAKFLIRAILHREFIHFFNLVDMYKSYFLHRYSDAVRQWRIPHLNVKGYSVEDILKFSQRYTITKAIKMYGLTKQQFESWQQFEVTKPSAYNISVNHKLLTQFVKGLRQ